MSRPQRALVIGADGFVGSHLVRHLADEGDDVVPVSGPGGHAGTARTVDVRDPGPVAQLLRDVRPDAVYHLAAVNVGGKVEVGGEDRGAEVTVDGTRNVLEAAAVLVPRPVVHVPSSAMVYGAAAADRPLREADPLAPESPYAVMKSRQEALSVDAARSGLPVVVTRSFNHVGPGQRPVAALPSFAGRLAEIAVGRAEPTVEVGNLDVVRDFSDVRDAVRAFRRLVAVRPSGPVNVCSGVGSSLRGLLEQLVEISGLTVEVAVDPARLRASDPPAVIGDPTLLRSLIGWAPAPPTAALIRAIWDDALARARAGDTAVGAR